MNDHSQHRRHFGRVEEGLEIEYREMCRVQQLKHARRPRDYKSNAKPARGRRANIR